ncbi:MAG TPA: tRNA uridine-5-carboxymethylaminomethyl(34) synthesis GTPase MnmE [Polyangia bacterium]|nr:tRNA uridine-5-carboxymethylaminomethyl(34) synthesis GTPase MnmE [Polyangia bacterium]
MSLSRKRDTIAAIATAVGGGVGIVRLSGPAAEAILAQLVIPWPSKRPPSHKLHYGHVRDPSTGETLDEVLACVMRAPRSYTGEDVAELHGHGGALAMRRLLEAALQCGARLAEPGEFTRRAFEAGRIDLTRAEAVAELIGARSEKALAAARARQSGALEREIGEARRELVRALAELDGAIDFPDEKLDADPERQTAAVMDRLSARLKALASSYRRFLHEGAEVALVGRVNAGKSSLFNALAGEERALVDAEAGTTRDVLEAQVELGGVLVRLVDTAGERLGGETHASVERRGVELGRRRRGRADVVALVVDGTVGFAEGERELWAGLAAHDAEHAAAPDAAARLIVWNKRDLAPAAHALPDGARVVETSALSGAGVDALRSAIAEALGQTDAETTLHVTARQREALDDGAAALARAAALLSAGEPPELAAVDARAALHHLGRVTGETVDAEVLDAIFARFCIGK